MTRIQQLTKKLTDTKLDKVTRELLLQQLHHLTVEAKAKKKHPK
jgi:hypothetical protein